MKALLLAALLCAGCSGISILNPLDPTAGLSGDQIKALKENGQVVYGCFHLAGPPPGGSMIWLVLPQGVTPNLKFGDGCHILQ